VQTQLPTDCIKAHMENSLTCMLVPSSEKLALTISGRGHKRGLITCFIHSFT
jgi:hypothetical protein